MAPSRSVSPSRDISTVLAESELQWLYDEEELLYTPSVENGMPVDTERELRVKGVTFIHNVGGLLNVPQTTVTTAAVYFHRFLMRYSLKPEPGQNPKEVLHHYVR
jgi:protein BUR2